MFKFDNLGKFPEIAHFVTDREFGEVMLERGQKKISGFLNIDNSQVIFVKQRHKDVIVKAKMGTLQKGDALVTDERNLCLAVRVADCIPILLYDPRKNVIASIHAGWRGTVKQIAFKTLQFMEDKYGVNPANVVAGIGPSIGPCCFKIKEDVSSLFEAKYKTGQTIDLWKANYDQLLEAGADSKNVETSNICTKCNLDKYFSYRATGEATSFACGIMLL